jgi:MATE family multidrug resistance protein
MELEPFLAAIGEPPAIAHLAGAYARAFGWAVPGILWSGTLRNYLAAFGRTGFVMVVSALALGLNLLLNWMLIFGHLGAPTLGLPGSGYATAIVAGAMAAVLTIYAWLARLLPRGMARLSLAEFWHGLREVLVLGLPIAGVWWLEIGMFSCSSLLMGRFGPVALAAHQICINLVSLTYTVPSAISTAATVRVGFHIGARAPGDAGIAGFIALALGIAFMALAAIVLSVFARPIVGLYLDAGDSSLPRVQA